MTLSGIYQIRNLVTGKVYIGSSVDIKGRWLHHRSFLKRGVHSNFLLQRAWNKYGEDGFKFEVLEDGVDKDVLFDREQWYLDNKLRWGYDYNLSEYADVCAEGREMPDEIKRKLSALSLEEELEIQDLYKNTDYSTKEIGKMYGVSRRTVSRILKRDLGNGIVETRSLAVSKDDYKTIQDLYMTGKYVQQDIANMWGVSDGMIWKILRTDLGEGIPKYPERRKHSKETKNKISRAQMGEKFHYAKLTWEKVREIRRLFEDKNWTENMLIEKFNMSQSAINKIVRYKIWKE